MSQTDALKKYLDAGMAFTALTRSRAEQVVKDLVAAGDLQRNQAKGAIDELLDRSRKNTETLAEQVRKEVDSQLANLGLARKADVERLEEELAKLKGSGGTSDVGGEQREKKAAPPSKPAPARKAPAKKAAPGSSAETTPVGGELPAKKAGSGAGKAPAKKSGGPSDTAGTGSSMPAKKTAKKQG